MWSVHPSDEYIRRQRKLEKRYQREVGACAGNAERYLQSLQQGAKPKQIQGGWIHPEPNDVLALDQRGGGKKASGKNTGKGLVEMRLYVFPDLGSEVLHLITLGLKDTQQGDIKVSQEYVERLKAEFKED